MNTKVILRTTSQTSSRDNTQRKVVIVPGSGAKDFIVSAPCRILKKGSKVPVTASELPGSSGGTFTWRTESKLLKLSATSGAAITVKAVGDNGSGRDSESIEVKLTEMDGTVKSKTVLITVAKVMIRASPNQLYGFDDFDTPNNHTDNHVSVRGGSHTFVAVEIVGGATSDDFSFDIADPDISQVEAPQGATNFDLRIDAAIVPKESTELAVRVRCLSKENFAALNIHVYAEKVARIRICKLADTSRSGTHLKWPNADYAAHAAEANKYLKAGVASLEMVNFEGNSVAQLSFAGLAGDALRFDMGIPDGGADIERVRSVIKSDPAGPHDIVIVRKIEFGFYLAAKAKAGAKTITVIGERFREGINVVFDDGANTEEAFVVKGLDSNVARLKAPLKFDHPAGTFVRLPVLGTSRDIVLMQEEGIKEADMKWVITHEAIHAGLNLRDLDDRTNIMHFKNDFLDYRIRYVPRKLKKYPGYESQWDAIDRPGQTSK